MQRALAGLFGVAQAFPKDKATLVFCFYSGGLRKWWSERLAAVWAVPGFSWDFEVAGGTEALACRLTHFIQFSAFSA